MATPLLDISVGLTPDLPVWTGSPGHSRRPILSRSAGDDANATELSMDVHCGTHVDAPRHFIDDGVTIEELSLDRLNGATFVAQIDSPFDIEPEHLDAAAIPAGAKRVLLRTSNSEIQDLYSTPFRTDYAALSPAGAEWVRERGVEVVGIDYLSIQRFHDPPDAHVTILGAGIVIIEGLRLTHAVPGWHEMICMPIRLDGAEAAPARVALRPLQQGTPRNG